MAMNELYAPKPEVSSKQTEKYQSFLFERIGDKIIGTILEVGDAWDKPNKFYKEGEPDWKKTVKTQKVNLQTENGPRSLYLSGRMFQAVGAALAEVKKDDLVGLEGWTLGFKLSDIDLKNKNAKIWDVRLVAPSE